MGSRQQPFFSPQKIHWYRAVVLGSLQTQTVFIVASVLKRCKSTPREAASWRGCGGKRGLRSVSKECWPTGHRGPHWWPLEWRGAGLGFGFGEHADDVGSFIAPPAGYFDTRTTKRHLVLCNSSGCVRSFLLHSRLLLHRSLPVTLTPLARYQSITKVVFTASWLPPHIGNSLAVTFMRLSWKLARFWMLKLASRVFVHKTTCGRIKCLISVI